MIALILKLLVQISSISSLQFKSIFLTTKNNLIQGQLRSLPPQKCSICDANSDKIINLTFAPAWRKYQHHTIYK